MEDDRQYAPATARNRDAILSVLTEALPKAGNILEISSGTGEHAVYFAPFIQPRLWIPSDPNPIAIASIMAWQKFAPAPNLVAPLSIDVTHEDWHSQHDLPHQNIQAIVNINMIHISPWSACLGLMAGASELLPQGGILYLYGPYKQDGQHTAVSNADFDISLRSQNPDWGVRDLNDVVTVAKDHQLSLSHIKSMPANNLSVIFTKA
ncbi:MAG: DUF938 domain-containing protein [Pseudanabaenaceae cyanobacterium bins.39]|nr:DUF938 domain-containing protein [Pseudanabaenaceae cyanobacterium bins.39]